MYVCGYELPTNLQNFMVKIFQKVLGRGGGYFFETPCMYSIEPLCILCLVAIFLFVIYPATNPALLLSLSLVVVVAHFLQ